MERNTRQRSRRNFLRNFGASTLPFVIPATAFQVPEVSESQRAINFVIAGLAFSPEEYLEELNKVQQASPIEKDFYGRGGTTKLLEAEFAKLTGKEKAIYMPSGTMANQIAIKLLSGNRTKVIVPENSHVFRDEADAAQSVHNKRLIPVGKGKPGFDLEDLKNVIEYTNQGEVSKSGLGAVVIENPVRRADGHAVPLETIKAISAYCKAQGYKMHLDGARLHMASAFNKIPVAEYASYFDTVYISLYKYLNASGGAVLCGAAEIIDQVTHQIKIHGGAVFQTWHQSAVALHYLNGIDERLSEVVALSAQLMAALNKVKGVEISRLKNGSNIHHLKLDREIDAKALSSYLNKNHRIRIGRPNKYGVINFVFNESLLYRPINHIIDSFQEGIESARG